MIGAKVRYETRDGKTVSAICYDERASLPVFSVEVVDREGEVVECFDVSGSTALDFIAVRRGWRAV